MEKRLKKKSLKRLFLEYLSVFSIAVAGTLLLIVGLMMFGVQTGFIIPSNYEESIIKQSDQYMQQYGNYSWIPKRCEYIVYDSMGDVLQYSDSFENADAAFSYFQNIRNQTGKIYTYKFQYEDQICIVRYRLEPGFCYEWMNRFLPEPDLCAIVSFILLFFLEVFVLASKYTKKIAGELSVVKKATQNIKRNQLDFNQESTQIKELNEVLDSLNHMREELTQSLNSQWSMQEQRKEQIQALAHDIKTPLTVLYGNAELMQETDLTNEQQEYCKKMIESADDMENYLRAILELAKEEEQEAIVREKLELPIILDSILQDAKVLAQKKEISVELENTCSEKMIYMKEQELKRILGNLISNSVEYVKSKGRIRIRVGTSVLKEKQFLQIVVEDNGRGFTQQELQRATEQFYQGDESRSSRQHYGLGLANVKIIVENYDGTIELSNSYELGGAMVTILLKVLTE